MNWKLKLLLMNLAVVAALFYRWHQGIPATALVVTAVIAFGLVNILVPLTSKRSS